jgi:hypothetical protein
LSTKVNDTEVEGMLAAHAAGLLAGVDEQGLEQLARFEDERRLREQAETLRKTAVGKAAFDIQVRREAQRLVDAQERPPVELPRLSSLAVFLEVQDEAITHRIAGLWPSGGRVVLTAPPKIGKSTTVANVLRSLADGDAFLGQFAAQRAKRVVLLDNELDERMLRRWLREHQIVNVNAVAVASLRGRLSTFDILDPATRTRWAQLLGPADVLIFDCLRPALDALGLDENRDAGRFLEALDELTTEAGISETLVIHHTGHTGERSRGDSRIIDWPDAIWKLVRDTDADEANPQAAGRYFTAYGRDVDQPETLLAYDPTTRHLTAAGGTRRDTREGPIRLALVELLADAGMPLSGRAIEGPLTEAGHARDQVRGVLKKLVREAVVQTSSGPRNAVLHSLNPASAREFAEVRERTGSECASAPIGRTLAHSQSKAVSGEDEAAHSNLRLVKSESGDDTSRGLTPAQLAIINGLPDPTGGES